MRILLLLAMLFPLAAHAAEAPPAQEALPFDMMKYEGAEQIGKAQIGYDEYEIDRHKLVGRVVQIAYIYAGEATAFEILKNYEQFLNSQGLATVKDTFAVQIFLETFPAGNHNYGVFSKSNLQNMTENYGKSMIFQKKTDTGDITARVMVYKLVSPFEVKTPEAKRSLQKGNTLILVDVVLPKTLQNNMVKEDISFIAKALQEKGKVDLYGIYFDFNKADVKPESADTVTAIANVLKAQPTLHLSIIGHTDNVGAADYNQKLSETRAQAVMQELVQKQGIEAARLSASGKGATQPVAANDNEQGRARNRRVELIKTP